MFGVGEAKDFRTDLVALELKLARHEPFAFSKFADGEWAILAGRPIDTTKRWNGEFRYRPDNEEDRAHRRALLEAFTYQSPNYYVGIGCRCCMGDIAHTEMRIACDQPAERLTWANLFVNSNYAFYRDRIIPQYATYRRVRVVCNSRAVVNTLPFRCHTHFGIGTNAWADNASMISTVSTVASRVKGELFLFCAGPLGNRLAHKLNEINPENTYLDIGSTLDPWLFSGKRGMTRRYLRGEGTVKKACVW